MKIKVRLLKMISLLAAPTHKTIATELYLGKLLTIDCFCVAAILAMRE